MLLSNINTHIEQGSNNTIYFNPNNHFELSKKLIKIKNKKSKNININKLEKNYKRLRENFSNAYFKILNF